MKQQEESILRPNLCSDLQQKGHQKVQQNPVKELGRDTQRLPEARDPQVMQHSYCGIETAQERYHEIQERKNRDVLLKYPVVQQRIRKYKANIHEQRSCTTRNQE